MLRRVLRWIGFVLGLGVVAGGSYYGYLWLEDQKAAKAAPAPQASARPAAVYVERVAVRDLPVTIEGIGTVQGLNTVTVRSRVEGAIVEVAFQEGQTVKAGDILFRIDSRPYRAAVDQARAKLAQSQSNLANLKNDLERYRQLADRDIVSRQKADSQQSQVTTMLAQIEADRAAIEAAQAQLDYTTIRSPIDGRVGLRMVDAGNMANNGTALVVVTQTRPITALFTLPESTLPALTEAMRRGPVPVAILGRDLKLKLAEARLDFLDNQVDASTGTIRAKSTVANDEMKLWPGQFVNVKVEVDTLKGKVAIPSAAVQTGPNGEYVYVIGADKTAEARPVQVGQRQDTLMVINQGLKAGEVIVTDGGFKLRPGMTVIPVPAGRKEAPAQAVRRPS